MELIIDYKINVKSYKYKDALFSFKQLVNFFDIDNLDLSIFNNYSHLDHNSNSNERKRNTLNKNNFIM
jgi:hypothetical protein